jgi:hypothetical protein
MNWPWPTPTRRDIAGVLLGILIVGAVLLAAALAPKNAAKTNGGFGPEWDCVRPGAGGAVCIKQPVRTNNLN